MSKGAQLKISRTRTIAKPNAYIVALNSEYASWAYDEERVLPLKGRWRAEFGVDASAPLDLEIGTGNGTHFAHYAASAPQRNVVGLELKYKPLIQTIRRCRRQNLTNARVARYNAVLVHDIFGEGELDRVLIHFPDPWERLRQQKHRLIQDHFLARLFALQKPGSELDFKTDSRDYFLWAVECFARSPYTRVAYTEDLHHSEWAEQNFVTHFEEIFLRKGQPIHFARFIRK